MTKNLFNKEIDFLQKYSQQFEEVYLHPERFYTSYTLPKRKGGTRTISIPSDALRKVQRRICRAMAPKIGYDICAHGYIRSRSCLTNAKVHANCRYLLKMDMKDFFPSVSIEMVRDVFLQADYSTSETNFLAALCTLTDKTGRRGLPQGAPTSPFLSNLAAKHLDSRLYALARKNNFRYTRYADDLTFSNRGDSEDAITPSFIRLVTEIIENEGFCVNESKTALLPPQSRKKIVTGLNISSETITIPRSYKRLLRVQVHQALMNPDENNWPSIYNSLRAKLGYVLWIEPDNAWANKAACLLDKVGKCQVVTVNGVQFEMISVEGIFYDMGAMNDCQFFYDSHSPEAFDDEQPVHTVYLSDYFIGTNPVTQEIWEAVMGNNPSTFKGKDLPVHNVSWEDCQDFLVKLNQLNQFIGLTFRLPTEAEWEYAAGGGFHHHDLIYSGSNTLETVGWNWNNSGDSVTIGDLTHQSQLIDQNCRPHAVGLLNSNELKIHDMSGNVWEWCQDFYGPYRQETSTNPMGPSTGIYRVLRGGSWCSNKELCTITARKGMLGSERGEDFGVRLVAEMEINQ